VSRSGPLKRNPILRVALIHTVIVFVVLHGLAATVYFHVLPFTTRGMAISYAERLIENLTTEIDAPDREEVKDFFEEEPNVKVVITNGDQVWFTNDVLFFKSDSRTNMASGPYQQSSAGSLYHGFDDTIREGPLAGMKIRIARNSLFIDNAVNAVIIRYEFLVVLICIILFYVFLTTLNVQLEDEDIDDDFVRGQLNAAGMMNTGITVSLIMLMALSYYKEGLMYAFFHQLEPMLSAQMSDFHPLVNALILILLVVVEVVTGSIPGAVLYPGAGCVFGAQLGAVYILIGTVLGSAIGYLQGHAISLTFHESETQAAEFSDYIKKQGSLGVFILRLNPITSFSFINQVCGVLRSPFTGFILATTLGRAPMVLLATFLGEYVFHHLRGAIPFILGLLTLYILYLAVRFVMDAGHYQRKYIQLYVNNINQIGAATQSSDFLAKKMIDHLPLTTSHSVLELGPGTGVFTERLLESMPESSRLITIEANEPLARLIQSKFPSVTTIRGDASEIKRHLKELDLESVDIVVSGLPFLSFPQELSHKILSSVRDCLSSDGTFVLFQYTLILLPLIKRYFTVDKISWTPFNVPPAFVLTCHLSREVGTSRSPQDHVTSNTGRQPKDAGITTLP